MHVSQSNYRRIILISLLRRIKTVDRWIIFRSDGGRQLSPGRVECSDAPRRLSTSARLLQWRRDPLMAVIAVIEIERPTRRPLWSFIIMAIIVITSTISLLHLSPSAFPSRTLSSSSSSSSASSSSSKYSRVFFYFLSSFSLRRRFRTRHASSLCRLESARGFTSRKPRRVRSLTWRR